jgi:hypothetical protein
MLLCSDVKHAVEDKNGYHSAHYHKVHPIEKRFEHLKIESSKYEYIAQ